MAFGGDTDASGVQTAAAIIIAVLAFAECFSLQAVHSLQAVQAPISRARLQSMGIAQCTTMCMSMTRRKNGFSNAPPRQKRHSNSPMGVAKDRKFARTNRPLAAVSPPVIQRMSLNLHGNCVVLSTPLNA